MSRSSRIAGRIGAAAVAVAAAAGLSVACGAVRQTSITTQCGQGKADLSAPAFVAAAFGGAVCTVPADKLGHADAFSGALHATLDYDRDERGWLRNVTLRITESGKPVHRSTGLFDERIARARSSTPQDFLVVSDATVHFARLADSRYPDVLVDFYSAKRLPVLLRNPAVLSTIAKTGYSAGEYAAFIETLYATQLHHTLPSFDESPYSVLLAAPARSPNYRVVADDVPRDEFFQEPPAVITARDGRQALLVHRYGNDRTRMHSAVLRRDGDRLVDRPAGFGEALGYESRAAIDAFRSAGKSWPPPSTGWYEHHARSGFIDDDDLNFLPWIAIADGLVSAGDPAAVWNEVQRTFRARGGWHWDRAGFPRARSRDGIDGYRFLISSGIYYRSRMAADASSAPLDARRAVAPLRLARVLLGDNIAVREDQTVQAETLLRRVVSLVRSGGYPKDACPAAVLLDYDRVEARLGKPDHARSRLLELLRALGRRDSSCPAEELTPRISDDASLYRDAGEYEAARLLIERNLARAPNASLILALADLYRLEGDSPRALTLLDAHRPARGAESAAWTSAVVDVLLDDDPKPAERTRLLRLFDEVRGRLPVRAAWKPGDPRMLRHRDDLLLYARLGSYLRAHPAAFAAQESAAVRRLLASERDLDAYEALSAPHGNDSRLAAEAAQAFLSAGRYAESDALLAAADRPDSAAAIRIDGIRAASLFARKRTVPAQRAFESLFTELFAQIDASFPFMSEPERLAFIGRTRSYFSLYYSFAAANAGDPVIARFTDDLLLREKAMVRGGIASVRAVVARGNDPRAKQLLDRISLLKSWSSTLSVARRTPEQETEFRGLADRINTLERELNVLLLNRGGATTRTVHWADVAAHLHADAAAVEIVRYAVHTGTGFSGKSAYAAVVVRPGRDPEMVALGDGTAIDDSVRSATRGMLRGEVGTTSSRLYALLWSPLLGKLAGVHTVFFAPDGVFNQLPLDIVRDPAGAYLGDRYDIRVVTSTRSAALDERPPSALKSAVLFGDPAFRSDSRGRRVGSVDGRGITFDTTLAVPGGVRQGARGLRGGAIPQLPGARVEVAEVARELEGNAWTVSPPYVGSAAVEDRLKAQRAPRVLHIATHGFFFEAAQFRGGSISGRFSSLDDPMMRSGLLFAGAQRAWSGERPAPGSDDGILTSNEATSLDLVGTELVVLSACDTGLGDVQDGEGVFGLRRAFEEAGARYVLMSMWEIDDAATRDLMKRFYRHWIGENMEIHAALRTAEQDVRAEVLRKNHGRDEPRLWGAFVLTS